MGSHLLSDCQNTEEGNASECLTQHIPSSSLWNYSQSLFWFCPMCESWLHNNVNSIINVNPNVDVNEFYIEWTLQA